MWERITCQVLVVPNLESVWIWLLPLKTLWGNIAIHLHSARLQKQSYTITSLAHRKNSIGPTVNECCLGSEILWILVLQPATDPLFTRDLQLYVPFWHFHTPRKMWSCLKTICLCSFLYVRVFLKWTIFSENTRISLSLRQPTYK